MQMLQLRIKKNVLMFYLNNKIKKQWRKSIENLSVKNCKMRECRFNFSLKRSTLGSSSSLRVVRKDEADQEEVDDVYAFNDNDDQQMVKMKIFWFIKLSL
jgi:hypothetical protein